MNRITFLLKYVHLQIWILILLITASLICAQQLGSTTRPTNFPSHIELKLGKFENWARQYIVKKIWIAYPTNEDDCVELANWAQTFKYNLRPVGSQHTWAPFVITGAETRRSRTILIDTTKYLTNMELYNARGFTYVRVQTGRTLLDLLEYLEENGKGLVSTPAIGIITVGGMLAINAHGAGVPNVNEPFQKFPAWTYGSISNLVQRIRFVGWSDNLNRFTLKTATRIVNNRTTALITNLGRLLITEVDLQVVDNYRLRCKSRLDIKDKELFAKPGTIGARTIYSFLKKSGRVETIQFPFTEHPWLKVWTKVDKKPFGSRLTKKPYNYIFTDRFPLIIAKQPKKFLTSYGYYLTPVFMNAFLALTATALPKYKDLYGWSKNTMLYIKPTSFRYHEHSNVILTNDTYVQQILSDIVPYCNNLIKLFANEGKFPVNGPIEIRITSLDVDDDKSTNYVAPALSTLRPPNGTTHYQIAIWFAIGTFPDTPYSGEFFAIWEQYLVDKFNNVLNSNGLVRPEWSKGWGLFHHDFGLSENRNDTKFLQAICFLNKNDPDGVFFNDLLEQMFDPNFYDYVCRRNVVGS